MALEWLRSQMRSRKRFFHSRICHFSGIRYMYSQKTTSKVRFHICFLLLGCLNTILDVLLITSEECIDAVNEQLESGSLPELPGLNIKVVAPTTQTEEWGTADVLRHYASYIKQDFILISGDFISDINLHEMIELHYANNSVFTCLLSANACKSVAPGLKEHQPSEFISR